MRSRSGEPAYWRQKAAEFRRRALATADDSRMVLLRRALEFDRIAEELDELIGGDRPPSVAALAASTTRTRLAFVGVATAFARWIFERAWLRRLRRGCRGALRPGALR